MIVLTAAMAGTWPSLTPPPASVAPSPHDAAVIVAIEDYLRLDTVRGAEANGSDWWGYLAETRKIPLDRIHKLFGPQATRELILDELEAAAGEVGEDGTLWVVFIGHGSPSEDGKDGLLAGWDAQATARSMTARSVKRSEVVSAAGETPAVVVLDACFSGKSRAGETLVPDLMWTVPNYTWAHDTVTMLTAGRGDEFAGLLPEADRPAFSYLVLGAMRGWGDLDEDGTVTAKEAVRYSKGILSVLLTDRKQTPQLLGPNRPLAKGREKGPDLKAMVEEPEEPRAPEIPVELLPVAAAETAHRMRLEHSSAQQDYTFQIPAFSAMTGHVTHEMLRTLSVSCVDDNGQPQFATGPAECDFVTAAAAANALSRNHGLQPAYTGSLMDLVLIEGANGFRIPTDPELALATRTTKVQPAKHEWVWYDGDEVPVVVNAFNGAIQDAKRADKVDEGSHPRPYWAAQKGEYVARFRFVRSRGDGEAPRTIRRFATVETPAGSITLEGETHAIPELIVMKHEITVGQFMSVVDRMPYCPDVSGHEVSEPVRQRHLELEPNLPMICMNVQHAEMFAVQLSLKQKLDPVYEIGQNGTESDPSKSGWRLMTSPEFAYLARGGSTDPWEDEFSCTADPACLERVRHLRPVMQGPPNGYGLFDMTWNAVELDDGGSGWGFPPLGPWWAPDSESGPGPDSDSASSVHAEHPLTGFRLVRRP